MIYRLEFIESGEYYVLSEKELNQEYTQEQIESFKSDDMIMFYELPYSTRQLTNARKKINNEDFRDWYEEEFMVAPSLYDTLEYLYN